MSVSTERFLFEAITNSWIGATKAFLESGGDPNVDIPGMAIAFGQFRVICRQKGQSLTPLHVAVAKFCRRISTEGDDALVLVDTLVQAGASLDAVASFTEVRGQSVSDVTHEGYTPIAFAFWLMEQKELKLKSEHAPTRAKVDALVTKLLPRVLTRSTRSTEPTVTIPQSVVETYRKLLFSEDESDVKFVCKDGQRVPAHKSILAASSDYFRAAFAGPWAENDNNGEWKTRHASQLIKAVLSFVYMGATDGIKENPVDIVAIAAEWDIASLKQAATAFCVDTVSAEKFVDTLKLAHLYQLEELKQACHEFAKRNLAAVLTNSDVMSLPNENVALWDEIKSAVVSNLEAGAEVTVVEHVESCTSTEQSSHLERC